MPPAVESARHADMEALRALLKETDVASNCYVVVVGPKGVGKTTLVGSVLKRNWAVVNVTVPPGKEMTDIVQSVSRALVGYHWFGDPTPAARRVAWWLRLVGVKPTVVLRVTERRVGAAPADLAAATREILEIFKCRVIIDASPNSLDPTVLATKREDVLLVGEMQRNEVMADPVFSELFARLQTVPGLDELVWQVVGGSAMDLERLSRIPSGERFARDVHARLVSNLCGAERTVRESPADYQEKLLPLFHDRATLPFEVLRQLKVNLPNPDQVTRMDSDTIKAASPVMAFVLRHQFYLSGRSSKSLSLDKLVALAQLTTLPDYEAAGAVVRGEPSRGAKH